MSVLEPKPLTAMKTKRGNFLLAVGATSEICMRRMLDIDIDYDGIANLNRPFLTTSINRPAQGGKGRARSRRSTWRVTLLQHSVGLAARGAQPGRPL